MPMIFRATDRTLRELGEGVARDRTLTPAAKDRLMKFLNMLDKELPKVHERSGAQITLDAILPLLERLAAVLREAPMPQVPTPGIDDVAGMVNRVALIIDTARAGRQLEAETLIKLNAFDPGMTTHGNVIALLKKLEKANDRTDKGNPAKSARRSRHDGLDADDGAGRSGRSAGAPDDPEGLGATDAGEGVRS